MIEFEVLDFSSLDQGKVQQLNQQFNLPAGRQRMVIMDYQGTQLVIFAAKPISRFREIRKNWYPGKINRIAISTTELNKKQMYKELFNTLGRSFNPIAMRDKDGRSHACIFYEVQLEEWIDLCRFIGINCKLELPPLEKIKTMDFPNKSVNQFLMEHVAEVRNKMDSFNPWHKVPDPKAYGRKINSTVAAEWFNMSNRELYEMIDAWNLKIWKSSRVNKTKFLVSYNELILFRRKLNYLNRQMKKGMIPMNKSVEKVRLNLHLSTNNVWELRNELSEHKMNYDEFIGYLLKEHYRDESKVSDDVTEYNELAKSLNQMNKNIIAMQKEIQNLEQQFADLIDINNED